MKKLGVTRNKVYKRVKTDTTDQLKKREVTIIYEN